MPTVANTRRFSAATVIIFAMITVLLPLCMMVGCGMTFGEMASAPALGLSSACLNTMVDGPLAAINPGSPMSFILLLVAVLGVVFVLAAPGLALRPLCAAAESPPAPPLDPRGVRLIV